MFTVRWVRSALEDLANIWLLADSSQRQAITSATHEIDFRLRVSPENQGESRSEGRRIFFVSPLGVTFRVRPEKRTVLVLDVWHFTTRDKAS